MGRAFRERPKGVQDTDRPIMCGVQAENGRQSAPRLIVPHPGKMLSYRPDLALGLALGLLRRLRSGRLQGRIIEGRMSVQRARSDEFLARSWSHHGAGEPTPKVEHSCHNDRLATDWTVLIRDGRGSGIGTSEPRPRSSHPAGRHSRAYPSGVPRGFRPQAGYPPSRRYGACAVARLTEDNGARPVRPLT